MNIIAAQRRGFIIVGIICLGSISDADADPDILEIELDFERRLAQIIIEADPSASKALSNDKGRAELRAQCGKARGYGLTTEIEIARYVITAWLMGLDFDTKFPAMAEILNSGYLSPAEKAEAIEKLTVMVLSTLKNGKS